MGKHDPSRPLSEVTFSCRQCYGGRTFKASPDRVEDAPEDPVHPWRYFAACPQCGAEVEQAQYERALLKAWLNATGPRTAEGKAATAANLEGHPTAEEALRTRFNAMKHGMSARVATYFPAKPDGYAHCSGCEVDRVWCAAQPACVRKTELFMLHQAAFEQRDPKRLMGVYSDLHAAAVATLQQILVTIAADGVKLETVEWYVDRESGELVVAEYVDDQGQRRQIRKVEAHPLFRPLGELISRLNISLSDLGMTVKVFDDAEAQMGALAQTADERESMAEFARRQAIAVENLAALVDRANKASKADPILIEYEQEQGEQGGQ